MKSPKKDVRIGVRIDISMKIELQSLADKNDRKLSDFIRLELEKIVRQEKKLNPNVLPLNDETE